MRSWFKFRSTIFFNWSSSFSWCFFISCCFSIRSKLAPFFFSSLFIIFNLNLICLHHGDHCILRHAYARTKHQSEICWTNFNIINSSWLRADLGHLPESDKIVESTVAFNVNSHTYSIVRGGCNSCNWNFSILQILALWEPELIALFFKTFKIRYVNPTIYRTWDQTFVLMESHSRNGTWMFFKEVLLNTKDHINDYNSTIN